MEQDSTNIYKLEDIISTVYQFNIDEVRSNLEAYGLTDSDIDITVQKMKIIEPDEQVLLEPAIELSDEDYHTLSDMIDSEPNEPTKALIEAMERHKNLVNE